MRINDEQKAIVDRAVRMYSDGMITIEPQRGSNVWKVNWCCCGAIDTTAADKFADDLKTAIKFADMLNEKGVRVDYEYTHSLSQDEAVERSIKIAERLMSGFIGWLRLLELLNIK